MPNTTFAQSYLKIDGSFLPIEECSAAHSLPDEDYIEGSISCCINGQFFLTEEHWDLVDQLWAYILEGLSRLNRNEIYESTFPDQPLLLRLEPISEELVKVSVGNNSYDLDRRILVRTLSTGANQFFSTMKKLYPNAESTWNRYIQMAMKS